MMMIGKTFLTGGSGLLGKAFVGLMTDQGVDFVSPNSATLDLLDFEKVTAFIEREKPDRIIHCAAYTNVDLAETERKKCWDINVLVLENLLKYKLPIVHFSTDYVFGDTSPDLPKSGLKVKKPDHPRAPLNYYGETKAAAEERLEHYNKDWWNIRTTWLYGPNGEGFPEKILQKVAKGKALSVIDDQYGRRTLSPDLAEFVLESLKSGLQTGHHHYQSPGPVHSWYDWAREITDVDITPISTDCLNLPAKRPKNSVLL